MFSVKARRKWEDWKKHAGMYYYFIYLYYFLFILGMSKEDAMAHYVEEVEKLKTKYGA